MTLLLFGALCLRAAGAALRGGSNRTPRYAVGWIFCTVAAWMAAGAAGAWFPVWPALMLGFIGALVDLRLNRRGVWTGADIIVVALAGLFSIPPLGLGLLMGTVVVVAVGGYAVDSLMDRFEKPVRVAMVLLLLLAASVTLKAGSHAVGHVRSFAKGLIYTGLMPVLHIGLAPSRMGDRIVLETGAVAWLEYPAGKGPFPGALFFHGAHHEGSRQPAATIIRRALLEAIPSPPFGYRELSFNANGGGAIPASRRTARGGAPTCTWSTCGTERSTG